MNPGRTVLAAGKRNPADSRLGVSILYSRLEDILFGSGSARGLKPGQDSGGQTETQCLNCGRPGNDDLDRSDHASRNDAQRPRRAAYEATSKVGLIHRNGRSNASAKGVRKINRANGNNSQTAGVRSVAGLGCAGQSSGAGAANSRRARHEPTTWGSEERRIFLAN
jgi:hypothetical protein